VHKQIEINFKVGLFVTIGAFLIMLAIILLGGTNNIFSRKVHYYSLFNSVDGLVTGSKVVLNGIQIGIIDKIDFDSQEEKIKVGLSINQKYRQMMREGIKAEIATQGVLGDRYISLRGGEKELLKPESIIEAEQSKSISQMLSGTESLVANLNQVVIKLDNLLKTFESEKKSDTLFKGMSQTAKNLASITEKFDKEFDKLKLGATLNELHSILRKINQGNGTVGALINDPALYDDVKSLVGGANRNRVIRNLIRQSIKSSEENLLKEARP